MYILLKLEEIKTALKLVLKITCLNNLKTEF